MITQCVMYTEFQFCFGFGSVGFWFRYGFCHWHYEIGILVLLYNVLYLSYTLAAFLFLSHMLFMGSVRFRPTKKDVKRNTCPRLSQSGGPTLTPYYIVCIGTGAVSDDFVPGPNQSCQQPWSVAS